MVNMTKFKDGLQEFPDFGRYRKYLPTAYDDTMTFYETLVAMREYLNEVIREVNQISEEWMELKYWIETQLRRYSRELINEMFERGDFDDIFEKMITPRLKEMNQRIDNNNSRLIAQFKELVESLQGGGVSQVVKNETELKEKFPNGTKGIVVTSDNGHYWYWDTTAKAWIDGGAMTGSPIYNVVRPKDGKAIRLDDDETWRANPDIITLKTGHYSVMVKTEEGDPEDPGEGMTYVITKNFPEAIKGKGTRCTTWVLEIPENNRKDFIVKSNTSNRTFTASLLPNGSLTPWAKDIKESELSQVQVWKTTYNAGQGFGFDYRTEDEKQKETTALVSRLIDLPTGVYYRAIPNKEELEKLGIPDDYRGLPNSFRGGSSAQVIVNSHTDEGTKTFIIMSRYYNSIWMGHLKLRNDDKDKKDFEIRWSEVGDSRKLFDHQRREFTSKVFSEYDPDSFGQMIITDTHIEYDSVTAQYSAVNSQHLDNFDDACRAIPDWEYRVHMGDVSQGYGNYESNKGFMYQSMASLLQLMGQFYNMRDSYAVYGNHDTNGGYAYYYSPLREGIDYYYTQEQMNRVFIKPLGLTTKKNYYHIDNAKLKIRKIFMNTFDYTLTADEKGVVHHSPYAMLSVSGEQVKWLIKTLEEVPEGYNVILYAHAPLDNVFGDYSQYPNGDTARKILQGYQNKRKDDYSSSDITNADPQWDWYKAEGQYDFTNRKGGDIICFFSGHRHRDEIKNIDGIQYVGMLCSKAEGGTDESKPPRVQWEAQEDSFRHVSINRKKNTIKLTTFGAGLDYLINYKTGEVTPKVVRK